MTDRWCGKLKTQQELKKIMADLRKQGKEVAFANGCFDLIHVGHIRYLRDSRREADVLVLGLNSDESVRKLKGKVRPIMPQDERAEILSGFDFVDYITVFGASTVDGILEELRPDVHCKGTDYTAETVPERETALKLGIRIAITGDPKDRSTTDYLTRMRS